MKAKYNINVDDLIKRTERMREIDWPSYYKAFGTYDDYSLILFMGD